jgi:hypothetical protein
MNSQAFRKPLDEQLAAKQKLRTILQPDFTAPIAIR